MKTYTQTKSANNGQQRFYAHFKDMNYEWLAASTEHKLFCYFLIQVKDKEWQTHVLYLQMTGECVIIWWVLYHAHCYGGVCYAWIIRWCSLWVSIICSFAAAYKSNAVKKTF